VGPGLARARLSISLLIQAAGTPAAAMILEKAIHRKGRQGKSRGNAFNQDHHFGNYIRIHLVLISLASFASFAVQLLDLG
jgi:hypothetical protein